METVSATGMFPDTTQTVNAVNDLNMDSTGKNPIDSQFKNAISDDVIIEFPNGKYLVTSEIFADNVNNFGIRGIGDNVQFVFPEANQGASDPANYVMFYSRGGSNLLLENFEIHQTDDKRTAASIIAYKDDGLIINNIEWSGFNPRDSYAKGSCLFPSITTVDGTGTISNITIRDGGVVSDYPHRRAGILVQGNHDGDLTVDSIDLRELGSSGFRCSNCSGRVTLKNSYFENIDNCGYRLGGGDHPNGPTKAVNCTVVADQSRLQNLPDGESYENLEGVRFDANGNGWEGATVENCDFIYNSLQSGWARGIITAPSFADHGSFVVADSEIEVNCDNAPPIWAASPGDGATGDVGVLVHNVHISGNASNWGTDGVIDINSRPDSMVMNCHIDVPNFDGSAVAFKSSNNCVAVDSILQTSSKGWPVTSSGGGVGIDNVTRQSHIRKPDTDTTPESEPTEPSEPTSHTLTVEGTGVATDYYIEVTGELTPDSGTIEDYDTVTSNSVDGWITNSGTYDKFTFTGEIAEATFREGEAIVTVDGEQITVS